MATAAATVAALGAVALAGQVKAAARRRAAAARAAMVGAAEAARAPALAAHRRGAFRVAQIDGSTLKTLCLQHGPLQSFHLYLNHGIALAKYQSREEANKAQAALNNCVLSNTTIFAESPAESEVHNLLSHLGGHNTSQQQQSGGSAPNWGMRSSSGGAGANSGAPPAPGKAPQSSQDTWGSSGGSNSSQLWSSPPTSSVLWGSSPMDSSGDQHRATPSAFLPGDLLGGESM